MKRLLLAVCLIIAVLVAGSYFVSLYSVPRAYARYVQPMRRFLAAAIALDSTSLAGMGASPAAVDWGLSAARANPVGLQDLHRHLGASWGGTAGESTLVLFRGSRESPCYSKPLLVTFTGSPSAARVWAITGECVK